MTRFNVLAMAALGVLFWFLGAMFIRYVPIFDAANGMLALLYAATIPVVWVSVRLAAIVARLETAQIGNGILVATAAALVIDGTALAWFPAVYSASGAAVPLGSAWLLWGAAWFAGFAVLASHGRA